MELRLGGTGSGNVRMMGQFPARRARMSRVERVALKRSTLLILGTSARAESPCAGRQEEKQINLWYGQAKASALAVAQWDASSWCQN